MTVPTGHKEFFGDGSGNAVVAPLTFATAGSAVDVYTDSELVLNLTGAGTAATFYEIRMMVARPSSTDWQAHTVTYGSTAGAHIVEQEAFVLRVAGSNGTHPFFLKTPANVRVRIDVRRVGGDGTTTALVTGYVRDLVGELSISSLSQSAGATLTQDVNIEQIAGSNTPATNVVGKMPTESDIRQIAGQNVATTGVNGSMPVEGTQDVNTAIGNGYNVPIGGETVEVPDQKVDNRFWNFILDRFRRQWVRSAAFDSLTTSDQITALNTAANDMDDVLTIDAEEDDIAAATYQYPSAAGRVIGTRRKLGWLLTIEDVTSCQLDVDLGDGRWVDITASLIDRGTGLTGYAATHFTSAAGVTTDFYVEIEHDIRALKYRWEVVVPNPTNQVYIKKVGRAL